MSQPTTANVPGGAPASTMTHSGVVGRAFRWLRHNLPEGRGLPAQEWTVRHRVVVWIIELHAVGLAIFGLVRGWDPVYALGESAIIALLGLMASLRVFDRRMRSGVAAFALVLSSAVLVQFWGGVIEGHFHFFVMVALVSLYQDWVPFLLAIAFVAVDHGIVGTIAPHLVYNHPAAWANPWGWAAIHAVLVLAECMALLVVWRANEEARADTDRILRSVGEGLIGVDQECRVTFANPAADKMTGGKAAGKLLSMMLVDDDGRPLFAGPDVLRNNPGTFGFDAWLARPDGEKVPVEVLCCPIEGRGHAEGAVVSIRDIRDRLQAERDRSESAAKTMELEHLKELGSFKARFMNMAAHELNTPLTPIKLQIHLLKNTAAKQVDTARALGVLERNFDRLGNLVQDILDSTRIQADRLKTNLIPCDLAPSIRETGESFAEVAKEKGIVLSVAVADELPARADVGRMTQAVSNLLVNAIKFTPKGGAIRLVAVGGDGTTIQVHDTGVGLRSDQVERLFRPFEQVHESQVAEHRGSGLGLYIARGIVERHGGNIRAQSEGPGKGSTFTIQLPPPERAPVEVVPISGDDMEGA